jgi:hypothetical protein
VRNPYQVLVRKYDRKGNEHFVDLDVDWRIMLKRTLQQEYEVRTGMNWLNRPLQENEG